MQVVVDSLLTQYERMGSGKTVLVLHGWGDSSKGWQEFATSFAKDYDTVVVNLPGFGGTQAPKETWGLDDYADFTGQFLQKLGIKKLYAVIAHSNGGAIAVRGFANGSFTADRLILLDSAGIRNQYKGRKKVLRIVTKAGKLLTLPLPVRVKKGLRRKVYKTVGSDMLVVERLQDTFKKVVTDDIQMSATDLQVPTLLIYGEDDLATPVQYGRILHNLINGSTFEVVAGAGHFVHLDKPEVVQRLIREFLK